MRTRLITALAGAAALLGVGAADARAGVDAVEDPGGGARFLAVSGSTIRIRVRDLLANDRATGPTRRDQIRFVRAFRTAASEGVRRISLRGGFLVVRLANDFAGETRFKYEVRSVGRDRERSRASVFLRVLPSVSPSS